MSSIQLLFRDRTISINPASICTKNVFHRCKGRLWIIIEFTRATVLARLLYAAPAWRGFFLVHAKVRVDLVHAKVRVDLVHAKVRVDLVHAKVRVERFIAKSVTMGYLLPNNCD